MSQVFVFLFPCTNTERGKRGKKREKMNNTSAEGPKEIESVMRWKRKVNTMMQYEGFFNINRCAFKA